MIGPIRAGGEPLQMLSSRCRYVVGVTSNAPRLKVGSRVKIEKTLGLVQNRTKSSSWRSRANTNAGLVMPLFLSQTYQYYHQVLPAVSFRTSHHCHLNWHVALIGSEYTKTWCSLRGSWDALRAFTTPPSFVLTTFRVSLDQTFGTELQLGPSYLGG